MCRTTACSPVVETQMLEKKKSVCFSQLVEILEYVPAASNMSCEERDSIWWHQDDIDTFLQTATKNSMDAMKHKLLMDGLDHALQNSRPQQQLLKLDHADDNMMDEYLRNVPEDRGLTLWCRFGHSRRGLERVSSRFHLESRAYAAEKSRAEVIRLSSSSSSSSSCGSAGAAVVVDEQELRRVSERSTIAAKVFARMMAISDTIAARAIDTMMVTSTGSDESQPSSSSSIRRAARRNTQPSYSYSSGGEDKNVPPVIVIPGLLQLLVRNRSMRRWSS